MASHKLKTIPNNKLYVKIKKLKKLTFFYSISKKS